MSQEYWIADEALDIVKSYLKYHPDLIGANIGCIFKEKASLSDGNPIVGKIAKVSPKYQCLMREPFDFIIEIGADAWSELNNAQKEAWVDHILEHAYGVENEKTGDMSWKLRNPDMAGFPNIIHRHGIEWMPGLAKIATLNIPRVTVVTPKQRREESMENPVSASDAFDDLTSDIH
jgi:hypothetical protein